MRRLTFFLVAAASGVAAAIGIEVILFHRLGREWRAPLTSAIETFQKQSANNLDGMKVGRTSFEENSECKDAPLIDQVQENEQLTEEVKRLRMELYAISGKSIYVNEQRFERLQPVAVICECTDPVIVADIFENLADEECAVIFSLMREDKAVRVMEAYTMPNKNGMKNNDNIRRIAEIRKLMQKTAISADDAMP
jgi:hypothetical protein